MEREGEKTRLFLSAAGRGVFLSPHCRVLSSITNLKPWPGWTQEGSAWPCSHCLHPLRSAMQINPNERAAEGERETQRERERERERERDGGLLKRGKK